MTRKKRGLGASNAKASKKNAPLKSSTNVNRARRGTQRKSSRSPAVSGVGGSRRRSFALYDGRRPLGVLILNEATNQALAWNASRQFLGRFGGHRAAAWAIGHDAETERKVLAARQRLDDPYPPFATGLPEHFLECDLHRISQEPEA
jgi:hypothetical protein